jgi:hypothetical protein
LWAKSETGSHISCSWECKRVARNEPPHSQMNSQFGNFLKQLQESKLIGLKCYLYHWKSLRTHMCKMGSHDPFGHPKHKLWPKERLGVKLAIWLPTIKSQELPRFPCVHMAWPLESSQQGLQLCFRPHLNWNFAHKIMGPQSCESPNFGNYAI